MYESLRRARIEAGLTQADMGEKMGLTMAGYRQKEIGDRKITIEDAQKISNILGKSLDDIFSPRVNQSD
jgi:transcriptional regulator with XRE-family HTH domain